MLLLLETGRRIAIRRLAEDPEGAREGLSVVERAVFSLLGLRSAAEYPGTGTYWGHWPTISELGVVMPYDFLDLARPMAHSSTRRIHLLVLGAAMLFSVKASGGPVQDRKGAATSVRSGIVKLPIVEKQDLRFLPFSLNGEAPRSRVLKFTQDDHGFLWLATTTGLYRYDGYSLKHYLHEPDDPASLSADRVSDRLQRSRWYGLDRNERGARPCGRDRGHVHTLPA